VRDPTERVSTSDDRGLGIVVSIPKGPGDWKSALISSPSKLFGDQLGVDVSVRACDQMHERAVVAAGINPVDAWVLDAAAWVGCSGRVP
jgi:hypothetical protein